MKPEHTTQTWIAAQSNVLRWATVVDHQIARLRQSRLAVVSHQRESMHRDHTHADNQPFYVLHGDAHFT